jgi:hypothetical protein
MPEEYFMHGDDGGGREKVMRVNYPANSAKAKTEAAKQKPAVQKIIDGNIVERKKSIFGKVVHDFVKEDSHSLAEYLVMEVLLPAAKNTITDFVSQGIERVLYGDSRPHRGRSGYTNYTAMSRPARADPRPTLSAQQRATHDFANIVIETRGEAEDVIDGLRNLIDQYQVASVADLYSLVGITGDFADNNWGWDDLTQAGVRAIRGGYVLTLPSTKPISS